MSFPVYCPKCERDEIMETSDGFLLCRQCGHRFVPHSNPTSDKALVELRKQTALLRRIISLLKKNTERSGR